MLDSVRRYDTHISSRYVETHIERPSPLVSEGNQRNRTEAVVNAPEYVYVHGSGSCHRHSCNINVRDFLSFFFVYARRTRCVRVVSVGARTHPRTNVVGVIKERRANLANFKRIVRRYRKL